MFKKGLFSRTFYIIWKQNHLLNVIFLNKAVINLELDQILLEILTDLLLTMLLAGQYLLFMAPEWRTMGLPCSSPAVSTESARGLRHEGRGHGMNHRAAHRRPTELMGKGGGRGMGG
jgi:hypothetical protein